MKKTVLDKDDLLNTIPHRDPYLMIDECRIEEPRRKGAGIKKLTGKEFFFEGHFPGRPIMPGVLIIEAVYQTALAVLEGKEYGLTKIKKIKFRQTIEPGDIVSFNVELTESSDNRYEVSARVSVDDGLVASGELILSGK